MLKALLRTQNDVAILFVRLGLGASLLPHGLEKLGIFKTDSPGVFESMKASAAYLAETVGGAPWMGYLAIAAEVLGSIALIFGFFGRFCALCIAGVLAVAAWKAGGLEAGEYLKWWRDAPGATTYGSYHLLGVLCGLAILIRGSGALSLDRVLGKPRP